MNKEEFFAEFEGYNLETLGYIRIPKFKIPQVDLDRFKLKPNCESAEYLRALAAEGFREKEKKGLIPKERRQEYGDRVKSELEILNKLGFVDYLLLIYSITKFCKDNDILQGYSRGSCGGSLILFLIGVIKIDAVKHDLLFERFISAARAEKKTINGIEYTLGTALPDVDLDSSNMEKPRINKFIESQFPNRTCAILTFGTLQSKVLIKDCLKIVEDAKEDATKEVSDLLEVAFGVVEELQDALKTNEKFKVWAENHKETITIAQKLQGLIKNKSVHASGVLLCENELLDTIPTELSSDKKLVSSYSMNDAQKLGVKIDNLGLKNLGSIKQCLDKLGMKMEDIDVNDPSIYQFLNLKNEFYGVFQAEEGLGKSVLKKIKPMRIDDIIASIAIGRPGCMRFLDEICKAKETGELRPSDPRVSDIVNPTYGIIIYQEILMKLCDRMANFTPTERDGVRSATGKKNMEKMLSYKEKFISQSLKNGYEKAFVEDTWRTFEDSGRYLFNCCLSPDTVVETDNGFKMMYEVKVDQKIKAYDRKSGKDHFVEVKNVFHNEVELFEIELDDGRKIKASLKHKFLCENGKMETLEDILVKRFKIITN